jgi:hypothetical protein
MRLLAMLALLACVVTVGCAAPSYQPPPAQREPGGGSNGGNGSM